MFRKVQNDLHYTQLVFKDCSRAPFLKKPRLSLNSELLTDQFTTGRRKAI